MKFPSLDPIKKRYLSSAVVLMAVLGLTLLIGFLIGLSISLIFLISGIALSFSALVMIAGFKLFDFFSNKQSDVATCTDDFLLDQTEIQRNNQEPKVLTSSTESEIKQRDYGNKKPQAGNKKKEYLWPICPFTDEDIRRFKELKKFKQQREIEDLQNKCKVLMRQSSNESEEIKRKMKSMQEKELPDLCGDVEWADEMRNKIQALQQQAEENLKYSQENPDSPCSCSLF